MLESSTVEAIKQIPEQYKELQKENKSIKSSLANISTMFNEFILKCNCQCNVKQVGDFSFQKIGTVEDLDTFDQNLFGDCDYKTKFINYIATNHRGLCVITFLKDNSLFNFLERAVVESKQRRHFQNTLMF